MVRFAFKMTSKYNFSFVSECKLRHRKGIGESIKCRERAKKTQARRCEDVRGKLSSNNVRRSGLEANLMNQIGSEANRARKVADKSKCNKSNKEDAKCSTSQMYAKISLKRAQTERLAVTRFAAQAESTL
jgi:hypothetical protein